MHQPNLLMRALGCAFCALVGYAPKPGRISMIKAFRHHLFAALSRATRSLDANRRRFLKLGAGAIGAASAVPVLATPALVVARPTAGTREMLGYRESEHVRHYYATARL
jgi:hypothetical protein